MTVLLTAISTFCHGTPLLLPAVPQRTSQFVLQIQLPDFDILIVIYA